MKEKEFGSDRSGSGTKEWAEHSVNIGRGCSHGCLYCYARYNAITRFKTCASEEEWLKETLTTQAPKTFTKRDGVIMFPTTHDITPYYLTVALGTVRNALTAGNKVLIVTKPHIDCIRAVCGDPDIIARRDNLLFRFTIGHIKDSVCALWEPGAPSSKERRASLELAFSLGFNTSVSMEPMLGNAEDAVILATKVFPFVTDTIWIGKMNRIEDRVREKKSPEVREIMDGVIESQKDKALYPLIDTVAKTYLAEKVRWKESIKDVIRKRETTNG